MTFVGKILVLVNLVMSCIFMAFAVLVYTTRLDLQGDLRKAKEEVGKLTQEKSNLTDKEAELNKQLGDHKTRLQQTQEAAKKEADTRQAELEQLKTELSAKSNAAAANQERMKVSVAEQSQRTQEVVQLRTTRDELLKVKADLVTEKVNLQDQLAQTQNDLNSALARNKQLDERLQQLSQYVVRKVGFMPDDVELARAGEGPPPPPDVKGIVTSVDPTGRFIELSIGEDDGIRKGQTLQVWRTAPEPKYLGKVKIFTTQATKSVAKPVTISGLIQEKDEVGPRILVNR